jgi:hypothetical protein
MTLVLCQVFSYLPLEENDELKMREVYATTNDTCYPHIQDVLDDASHCDEDIDHMEEVLSDWHMEKTKEDQGKIQNLEDAVKEDSLME